MFTMLLTECLLLLNTYYSHPHNIKVNFTMGITRGVKMLRNHCPAGVLRSMTP